jgi:dienelactone hydrolase
MTRRPYDPFARGPFPVGVRTIELRDDQTGRPVVTEIWYPATDAVRGRDLDPATLDRFSFAPGFPEVAQKAVRNAQPAGYQLPVLLFCHGGYGIRREATDIATHLASHGYVVAGPDFPGDNLLDTLPAADGSAAIAHTPIDESARRRPRQASSFLTQVLTAAPRLGLPVDATRLGAYGGSMGGYTALALNSVDPRPLAAFAMCPLCGDRTPVPQIRRLRNLLQVDDWQRPVKTFVLTGEVDAMVMADDVRDLYQRMPSPKRLAVMANAGHVHWVDNAEAVHERLRLSYLSGQFPDPEIDALALGTSMRPFAQLATETQGTETARALCLAHMDAALKNDAAAKAFLDGGLAAAFAARGVDLDLRSSPVSRDSYRAAM